VDWSREWLSGSGGKHWRGVGDMYQVDVAGFIDDLKKIVLSLAVSLMNLYLLLDSYMPRGAMALTRKSDIFATRARGSCGVDPGPVRLRIVILSSSATGDWLYGVRKRLVLVRSLMFSIFAMQRFTALAV
jgi:hypothetical protein